MAGRRFALALAFAASFSSFASSHAAQFKRDQEFAEVARRHVFMVDYRGVYLDPVYEWKLWGCDKPPWTPWEQFRYIEKGLSNFTQATRSAAAASPDLQPRVVVFVHGGLNSYANGLKRLIALRSPMLASNCYPIFVVWNSGLFSTYAEHLVYIRQGERRPVIGPITLPVMLAADLSKGAVRLPLTLSGRIYSDVQTWEWAEGRRVNRWEGFEDLISTNRPDQLRPPPKEGKTRSTGERIARSGQYLLTSPTKLASLPLLDAIGTEAWDMMLRRTRTMFEPPANYEVAQRQLRKWNTDRPTAKTGVGISKWLNGYSNNRHSSTGAMHYLSGQLAEWSTNTFEDLPFEFHAHSMGAIVLNEMFRTRPEIRTRRVAYFGAACSIHDFGNALFPYLRAHTNTHFYNVSLHRVRERTESNVGDLPARGSLLNWIDDIFAKPKTVTDRTLGTWENIVRALPDVPPDLVPRTHFSACALKPIRFKPDGEHPQVHGDFDDFPFWSMQFLWPTPGKTRPPRLPRAPTP